MQEKSRPISARVGALSAVALLAVSGTFIAGPAMADETKTPEATTSASPEPSAPAPETTDNGSEVRDALESPDTGTQAPGTTGSSQVPAVPGTETAETPAPALAAPVVTTQKIGIDGVIRGTAVGADMVKVFINGEDTYTGTTISADGSWYLNLPVYKAENGMLKFTVQASKGENPGITSEAVPYQLPIEKEAIAAPVITTKSIVEHSLSSVTGTGKPGATANIFVIKHGENSSGAPLTTTVGQDGTWRLTLPETLSYGDHRVSVYLTMEGEAMSELISQTITVAPSAPVITSITNNAALPANRLPDSITGSAMPGAEVVVWLVSETGPVSAIELEPLTTLADGNGNWSVPLRDLVEGGYLLHVFQVYNEAGSLPVEMAFTVTAAVADPPVTVNPVPAGNPGAPDTAPAATGTLPDTGAANLGLLAGGGAALLTAGGAALLFNRRRSLVSES